MSGKIISTELSVINFTLYCTCDLLYCFNSINNRTWFGYYVSLRLSLGWCYCCDFLLFSGRYCRRYLLVRYHLHSYCLCRHVAEKV